VISIRKGTPLSNPIGIKFAEKEKGERDYTAGHRPSRRKRRLR